MKLLKLTAFTSLLFAFLLGLASCEKNAEKKINTDNSRTNIPMNYAQEAPATPTVPSSALGTMDVFYSKETRILNYTIRWSGLTGVPTAINVNGLAPIGYPGTIIQTIITASNPTLYPATGTYSGTLLADGVAVKEQDILNGLYYINIMTAANPKGEIRGQVVFQ